MPSSRLSGLRQTSFAYEPAGETEAADEEEEDDDDDVTLVDEHYADRICRYLNESHSQSQSQSRASEECSEADDEQAMREPNQKGGPIQQQQVQQHQQLTHLSAGQLQEMAHRQQQQIESQQQMLVAKEQRLKYLRQQDLRQQQMAAEYERLRRLREKVCVHDNQIKYAVLYCCFGCVPVFCKYTNSYVTSLHL